MKNKSYALTSVFSVPQMLVVVSCVVLAACAGSGNKDVQQMPVATPTVDYIESLDVYSAPHKDSFLNQLAMNYRSFAVYNARTSGYSEMGELFAQKAVAAFSGELPFPETLANWPIEDEALSFDLHNGYNELLEQLKNDATENCPELAAEAQTKFDCWLSASASGQMATANECRFRFEKALSALRNGGKVVGAKKITKPAVMKKAVKTEAYYPETRTMSAMTGAGQAREGVIIVNNVNVPEHLINPVPVQPMVFNQNIFGGDKMACSGVDCPSAAVANEEPIPMIGEELVTREEFINMMMAMRSELAAINARLDQIQATAGERTMIKVQQIPLEPKQHVMEEIFEIHFNFNKSAITPEYQELIRKLATATQNNKNIKVSVVGHTDTSGSANYNYALGGRRAEAVQQMLIKYGIPASQIVAVSAGEEDLKVQTPNGVPNAENRRVRVVKEVHYTEQPKPIPTKIEIEEYSIAECGMYGCNE